jgi:hypothetical protein
MNKKEQTCHEGCELHQTTKLCRPVLVQIWRGLASPAPRRKIERAGMTAKKYTAKAACLSSREWLNYKRLNEQDTESASG